MACFSNGTDKGVERDFLIEGNRHWIDKEKRAVGHLGFNSDKTFASLAEEG